MNPCGQMNNCIDACQHGIPLRTGLEGATGKIADFPGCSKLRHGLA